MESIKGYIQEPNENKFILRSKWINWTW
jgi:hypothetical protein